MSRLLRLSVIMAILLFSAVLLLSVVSIRTAPAEPRGEGGGLVGTKNGDVNCDQRINIADPVYLLQYLFNDGPDTCALAQEGPGPEEIVNELKLINATMAGKWPPRPENIINLIGELGTGQEKVALQLPETKRAVLTNVHLNPAFQLIEKRADGETNKTVQLSITPQGFESPVGLAFAAGTQIVVRSGSASGGPPFYNLIGYLVDL